MGKKYYAHSLEGKPPAHWQPLEEHLKNVARLAADFARPFGGEEWAYLAGLWHDLGKYSNAFQAKLFAENGIEKGFVGPAGKVVHSEAGGHFASLKGWKGADRVLSWLIMCHHTGLTDFSPDNIGAKALKPKMRNPERSGQIIQSVPPQIANQTKPSQIIPSGADPAFFIRMLFSCLVDADFLDTEAFMNRKKAELRGCDHPPIASLLADFDQYMDGICCASKPTPINKIRAEVLDRCRKKAAQKPAIFSLTVPTGGGKTLSSLAFALRHAVTHHKRRIIYVIPYTSIIEQTAEVLRNIPGFKNAVLEHHCNVAEIEGEEDVTRLQLASENWDMPIIVTTSVQFFESLYGNRSSRCRKLHNIVNSVVVFDEIQCLPPKYIRPAVFAIRELYRHYLVTPLLCTATQPVLTQTEQFDFNFREGFESVTEVMENPEILARDLKRVNIELFRDSTEKTSAEDLAEAIIAEEKPVLCIVNRKDDARHLAALLPKERTMHLSTNMCAEHRAKILSSIKKLLKDNHTPFFVVSTSLVEAGVDIDFPVVYRALTGLDSIAQAAGRCNREGRLSNGKTVIFVPREQPDYVLQPAGITKELLTNTDLSGLLSPASYEIYFRQRFWQLGEEALDSENILQFVSRHSMNYYFRSAAEKFRLIDDDWQMAVITPYGKAMELIGKLSKMPWDILKILRKLQRYAVNIPLGLFKTLTDMEYLRELNGFPDLFLLDFSLYHNIYGFVPPEDSVGADPEKFIA